MIEVVSFDIFDTLVLRSVKEPKDVFDIVENIYNSRERVCISHFKERRVKAEALARKTTAKEEITLNDIYIQEPLSVFDSQIRSKLMTLEIEAEIRVCYANSEIKPLYSKAINEGRKVVITSDMYLPKDIIETILNNCGYSNFSYLFLSCEENMTKRTGSLFRKVISTLNVSPKQILHIGDNIKSDYIMPLKLGMHARKVNRKSNKTMNGNKYLNTFIKRYNAYSSDDYYKNFGYTAFGPLLYGYCLWLKKQFEENDLHKVYFFSRDGYIIKKAFDTIYSNIDLQEYYLEVSRRSLRVPILWMNDSLENLLTMIGDPITVSIKAIFDGVGLDISDYENLLQKHGLTTTYVCKRKDILEDQKIISLYNELKSDILYTSKEEYKELKKYLEQEKISGKFAIVDIGWTGGMQRCLHTTLDSLQIGNDIYGFYTGVTDLFKRNFDGTNQNMNGYLFDFLHNPNSIDDRSPFVGLYETLFLEGHGSVEKYVTREGHTRAIRYPYEYEHNGVYDDVYYIVQDIQGAALKFVKDAKEYNLLSYLHISPNDYFHNLREIGVNPSKEDIDKLGKITFYDEGNTSTLIQSRFEWGGYLIHPRILIRDLAASRWKIGFLKNLLKLNLPYLKIYRKLKKISRK